MPGTFKKLETLTFNRHIYQSADRSSERRLGPVGFPNLSEIPFLDEAKIHFDPKNIDMKKIALMVKNVIAWITVTENELSPVRVVNQRNPLNLTNKQ